MSNGLQINQTGGPTKQLMNKLNKEQQATWDRLNHVPTPPNRNGRSYNPSYDINSMYPSSVSFKTANVILGINKREINEEELKTFKVIKSR